MFSKIKFFFISLLLISCQPIELISHPEFDNSQFEKISILSKDIVIKDKYNPIFSDENIEDQLIETPLRILKSWLENNINYFGNQNKLVVNILEASISKKEIKNKDAKKYEEKNIYFYEVFYLVEYELYDDNDYLLANTTVESSRSTTSKKHISLNESEIIINDLLNKTLRDFINETISMTNLYMYEFTNN